MKISKVYIYTYNELSGTAKDLSRATGFRRIRRENSNFKPSSNKIIINWGASNNVGSPLGIEKCKIVNTFEAVAKNANKLSFFKSMQNKSRIVPWTEDINIALSWLKEGNRVCARRNLQAHSGKGLVIMDQSNIDNWIKASLYTRYIPKKEEYRIHFAFGDIIDIQRKALRTGVDKDSVDWQIRNLDNGFIYIRNDVKPSEDVLTQARIVGKLSKLDFGAIDILWNQKNGKAYVLEVNTAPGLEGTTLENYANVFKKTLL